MIGSAANRGMVLNGFKCVQDFIPVICENATLLGRRDFAELIKVEDFWWSRSLQMT